MPNPCCSCGQPVYVSRQSFQEHKEHGQTWVWHILKPNCPPPWQRPNYPRPKP